jgi:stress-induced morphogen
MPTTDEIETQIKQHLPGAEVTVVDTTGTFDHFHATVVAPQFEGLSLVEQHKLVYAALGDQLGDHAVHALGLRTSSPKS